MKTLKMHTVVIFSWGGRAYIPAYHFIAATSSDEAESILRESKIANDVDYRVFITTDDERYTKKIIFFGYADVESYQVEEYFDWVDANVEASGEFREINVSDWEEVDSSD